MADKNAYQNALAAALVGGYQKKNPSSLSGLANDAYAWRSDVDKNQPMVLPDAGDSVYGVAKTHYSDAPYYIPESVVGNWAYRNQGNILHALLGVAAGPASLAFRTVPNAIYMALSNVAGRTSKNYASEVEMSDDKNGQYWQQSIHDQGRKK